VAPNYTKPLGYGVLAAAGTSSTFTVPAGKVWVIRDVEIGLVSTTVGSVLLGSSVTNLHLWNAPVTTTTTYLQWQGRIALNTGDGFAIRFTTCFGYFYVTGYELSTT
jgi:hypothetical protein